MVPICRIEIDEPWHPAMQGLEADTRLEILYWMDRARRDLLVQAPRHRAGLAGTFALRSPMRPNPIATSIVVVVAIELPKRFCGRRLIWLVKLSLAG